MRGADDDNAAAISELHLRDITPTDGDMRLHRRFAVSDEEFDLGRPVDGPQL